MPPIWECSEARTAALDVMGRTTEQVVNPSGSVSPDREIENTPEFATTWQESRSCLWPQARNRLLFVRNLEHASKLESNDPHASEESRLRGP